MSALIIFSCRPNSHPFQERHVTVNEPVKIGRAVARARPSTNNAIFDCKVLSRNHAMLWYENDKFYLQDTKSSNGTFVNSQRLSKGSEESAPKEISSGDVIQFGVDVMENSRRVTHGCIITCVTLFHPDGTEAKADQVPNSSLAYGTTVHSQDLYQLSQYLQEALHREQMLENKLATLQRLVASTQEASESGWQALIDEDRLLSRLECLENQLHVFGKNQTEETLKQELVALQEDKSNYETTAKESLRKVLQEKLEAVRKLSDLERSLASSEDECAHLKSMCETSQKELEELAAKHEEQVKEMVEIQKQLEEAEQRHMEEVAVVQKEKAELESKLEEMVTQERMLSAKVESLQADNDFTKEQLSAMKGRMETLKEQGIIPMKGPGTQDVQTEIIPLDRTDGEGRENTEDGDETKALSPEESNKTIEEGGDEKLENNENEHNLEEKLKETQEQIENYKRQLEESDNRLKESQQKVEQLQNQLDQAQFEVVQYVTKVASLEEKLKLSDMHMNQLMENSVADLQLQLNESHKQYESSQEMTKSLQDQVKDLESEVTDLRKYRENYEKKNRGERLSLSDIETQEVIDCLSDLDEELHVETTTPLRSSADPDETVTNHIQENSKTAEHYEKEIEQLQELLYEARDSHKKTEQEIEKCKRDLEEATSKAEKSQIEADNLKTSLLDAQRETQERADQVTDLQEQVDKAESTTKEVKQQILALRDRLLEETEQTRLNQEEVEYLKNQLVEAQQATKQSHNEAEQLRAKVNTLQEELSAAKLKLEEERTKSSMKSEDTEKLAAKNKAEFASLKEECANLRKRIQIIENDMKVTRKENAQLSSDYGRLQESYKELEQLKEKLEHQEVTWRLNMTDAQKEADQTKIQLEESLAEITTLKDRCSQYVDEVTSLKSELNGMSDEYQLLADRSRMLSVCSMLPLLVLLFAILVAFYPALSEITATSA